MTYDESSLWMEVEDIMRIMRVSKPTAYKIMNMKGFPMMKLGRKYLVFKPKFQEWLEKMMCTE